MNNLFTVAGLGARVPVRPEDDVGQYSKAVREHANTLITVVKARPSGGEFQLHFDATKQRITDETEVEEYRYRYYVKAKGAVPKMVPLSTPVEADAGPCELIETGESPAQQGMGINELTLITLAKMSAAFGLPLSVLLSPEDELKYRTLRLK